MTKALFIFISIISLTSCGVKSTPQEVISIPSNTISQPMSTINKKSMMDCIYYDTDTFSKAITNPKKYSGIGKLVAGMIPHHLLAADMISGFFSLAAQQEGGYDTVLFVSPSHFPENTNSHVVTSTSDWNTPYGILKTDTEFTEMLIKDNKINAQNSSSAVELDHGVAGLVPFVKYYLPSAKVSVLLLSNKLPQKDLFYIQEKINKELSEKNILLVASADCSHYLDKAGAEIHDAQTQQAIDTNDIKRLLTFSDKNIDSPQAVTTFIKGAMFQGATLSQLDHSSSEYKLPHELTNPIYDDGLTSYFVYGAFKEEPKKEESLTYVQELIRDKINSIPKDVKTPYDIVKYAYTDLVYQTHFADAVGLSSWQFRGNNKSKPSYLENRALSVLAYNIGSCEDYAATLTLLLRELGFETVYIPGLTLSKENQWVDHAWCGAKINGIWYHLDPQLEDNITVNGQLNYRYFLKSDMEMSSNHIWGEKLIEFAQLSEEKAAEIRTEYNLPPCMQSYSTPHTYKFIEPQPPSSSYIESNLIKERELYIRENGDIEQVELNIVPPIFGYDGYGPPN